MVAAPASGTEYAWRATPLQAVLAFTRACETAVFCAVVSVLSCTRAVVTSVAVDAVSFASWVRALSTACCASVTACWSCCLLTSVGPAAACS